MTSAVLVGKYVVDCTLGQGAVGLVVRALHTELRQHVAIKMLHPEAQADAGVVQRFFREARAAARLQSNHVAKIMDFGRLENGAPYLVMEYLEGQDLSELLDELRCLEPATAVDYLLQAIDAVAEAHSLGIVHRDLKPANLFLSRGETIKVLDFGVAKMHDGASEVTKTSTLLGSPRYMSPEQFRCAKSVDHRSDVWALGAILYRLLSGQHAFDGRGVHGIMRSILLDEPPEIPGVPAELDAVIRGCLRKEPADRYADVGELARALAPFGTGRYTHCAERAIALLRPTVVSVDEEDGYAPTKLAQHPLVAQHEGLAALIGLSAGLGLVLLAWLVRTCLH